ncbi:hypothetical protein [Streptomyces sedi]
MSNASASVQGAANVLVWDASPLFHAAAAAKLDVLGDVARAEGAGHGET